MSLNKGDPSCPFLRKTVEGQPPRMVQPRLTFSGREERAVWRQEGWMGSNPGETDFVTQPAGKSGREALKTTRVTHGAECLGHGSVSTSRLRL